MCFVLLEKKKFCWKKKFTSHLWQIIGREPTAWGLSIIQNGFLLRENCTEILATDGPVTDFVRDTAELIPA